MILSINFIDKIIVIDGKARPYEAPFTPRNLRAIQWNGTVGHFEFLIGADIPFDNLELIEPYLTKYIADVETEIAEVSAEPKEGEAVQAKEVESADVENLVKAKEALRA